MNATATRKAPRPVQVKGRFVGLASRQDVIDGSAVLSITDERTGLESAYWVQIKAVDGQYTEYQLQKLGSTDTYTLPRNLAACDCPDKQFVARPGGCRHQVAMRQALLAVPRQ
jgi:hypothetical protein